MLTERSSMLHHSMPLQMRAAEEGLLHHTPRCPPAQPPLPHLHVSMAFYTASAPGPASCAGAAASMAGAPGGAHTCRLQGCAWHARQRRSPDALRRQRHGPVARAAGAATAPDAAPLQEVGAISEEDRAMYERMAQDVAVRMPSTLSWVYPQDLQRVRRAFC